jgi:hypothetical protein
MNEAKRKKAAEIYVKSVMAKINDNPDLLEGSERILGLKYKAAKDRAEKTSADIKQLRDQILQAEQRVQNMELQVREDLGKGSAFLESLIDLEMERQFETKADEDEEKEQPVVAA